MCVQEDCELQEELQRIQAEIKKEDSQNAQLKERADVGDILIPPQPDFLNVSTKVAASRRRCSPRCRRRISSSLGRRERPKTWRMATNILEKKRHKVDLGGECRIIVEAQPVHLLMPNICPHRILVSNLPNMDTEMLLSKLEIHFSKSKNGGGEVDSCDFLPDSGTVVIAFVMENSEDGLQEHHKIDFNKNKHTVRVTPFVNGKITNLKTQTSMCPRTVLLTGIPDVMDRETMQDMLEIHFQKNGNDGGEIEAFLYNPLGQQTLALFGSATPEPEEE
uniref:Interferon-induced protein 35 n=1 Tax=Xiphophorus couchianus TaxID=32473 RepID=A0A3B5MSU3_9TELE